MANHKYRALRHNALACELRLCPGCPVRHRREDTAHLRRRLLALFFGCTRADQQWVMALLERLQLGAHAENERAPE